jgi:hypothetical protein
MPSFWPEADISASSRAKGIAQGEFGLLKSICCRHLEIVGRSSFAILFVPPESRSPAASFVGTNWRPPEFFGLCERLI